MFEVGAGHQTIWEKGRIRDTKLAEGNRWIALFQIVLGLMCPAGPSGRGESLNGEISRVFRDAPAFYATLRGVNPKTIWDNGHTRDKTLAEGATRNAL